MKQMCQDVSCRRRRYMPDISVNIIAHISNVDSQSYYICTMLHTMLHMVHWYLQYMQCFVFCFLMLNIRRQQSLILMATTHLIWCQLMKLCTKVRLVRTCYCRNYRSLLPLPMNLWRLIHHQHLSIVLCTGYVKQLLMYLNKLCGSVEGQPWAKEDVIKSWD